MKTKRRLSEETIEQREERRRREAMRQAKRRAAETPDQKRLRRQRDAERKAKQRQHNRLRKSHSEFFELHMGALSLMPKDPVTKYSKKEPKSEYSSDEFFQCHICKLFIDGKCYVCVQCTDMYICASCELRDLHAHHYMLRVPALRPYEEVMTVLEKVKCDGDTDLLLEDGSVDPYSLSTCESEEIVEVECDPTHIGNLESYIPPVTSEDTDSSQTWDIVKNHTMDPEDDNEKIAIDTKNEDRNIPTVKLKKRKHETKHSQNLKENTQCVDNSVTKDKDKDLPDDDSLQNHNMDLEDDKEKIDGDIKNEVKNIPTVKLKKRKHGTKYSQNITQNKECIDQNVTKDPPRKSTRNKNPIKTEPQKKCNEKNKDNNQSEISTLEPIKNNKTIKVNQKKPKKAKKRLKVVSLKSLKEDSALENVPKPDNNSKVTSNDAQLDSSTNIVSNG